MMGGSLWFNSCIGEGLVFFFEFVLFVVSEVGNEFDEVEEKVNVLFYGYCLFFVEDNVVMCEVVEEMLYFFGVQMVFVLNGFEVVCMFQEEFFDFVLMDCQMLLFDGYSVIQCICVFEGDGVCFFIIVMMVNVMVGD